MAQSNPRSASSRYTKLADEMARQLLGPTLPQGFLDEFSLAGRPPASRRVAAAAVVKSFDLVSETALAQTSTRPAAEVHPATDSDETLPSPASTERDISSA